MLLWTEQQALDSIADLRACVQDCGLAGSTQLATALGWRAAVALAPGDMVLTFDHGMQPLTAVRRLPMSDPGVAAPVLIPAGALGNASALLVAPGQGVMVESDLAEEMTGDPFVLVEARALIGLRGIVTLPPRAGKMLVQIEFATDETVFTRPGVLAQCIAAADLVAGWPAGPAADAMLTGTAARDFALLWAAELQAAAANRP